MSEDLSGLTEEALREKLLGFRRDGAVVFKEKFLNRVKRG
jgi:hypothetical protein